MKTKQDVKGLCENAYELGKKYEKVYTGCGQCLVGAVQDALEMEGNEVFKAATGFAGGIGALLDGSCGGYVGGVMLLGVLVGREKDNFTDSERIRWKNYQLVKKYHDRFIEAYGSVRCSDIQTKKFGRLYFLADPEEFAKFEKAGGHHDHGCPELIGTAAKWLVALLAAENLLPIVKRNHKD